MKRPLTRRPGAVIRPSGRFLAASVEALEDRRLLALATGFGQIPVGFEANQGQVSSEVQFLAHAGGSTLFITPDSATLALPTSATAGTAVRMGLVGASATPAVAGVNPLPGATNYLAGANGKGAHLGLASYGAVAEHGVYPGVDLTYHAARKQLEYDFTVAPGANPGQIHLQFAGQDSATFDPAGNLILHTAAGNVVEQAPTLFQQVGGKRQAVAGHFTLGNGGSVGFVVGAYDKSLPLVIDPVLGFSTYLGGGGQANGHIAVDAAGDTYLTGTTTALTYPTTPGAYQTSANDIDSGAVVVTKLDSTGSRLIYSTYIGTGQSTGIAIDSNGNAYLTGYTSSAQFPTTAGSFQTTPPNAPSGVYNGFVTKLNPTGTALTYSTLLGGVNGLTQSLAIAVDMTGNAYVTGTTSASDFPTTASAFQTTALISTHFHGGYQEAYVSKLNPSGTGLIYSTFLGSGNDAASGRVIAVNSAGEVVVSGITSGQSDSFPTTPGAFLTSDAKLNELELAFVTKLTTSGSGLIYSTYLGGANTANPFYPTSSASDPYGTISVSAIALDAAENIYVTGAFAATLFPTTPGAYAAPGSTLFLTKIDPTSTNLVYSSIFGGSPAAEVVTPFSESSNGLVVTAAGNAIVTGQTTSASFPIVDALQPTFGGGVINSSLGYYPSDAFVSEFAPDGSKLVFSSYLGGSGDDSGNSIAIDPSGDLYVVGKTSSADFPTTPGAYDSTYAKVDAVGNINSDYDFFLAKIVPSAQFALATPTVPAKAGSAVVTITRTGSTTGTASVRVATSDGTATAGIDYTPVSQMVTFDPGVMDQDVTIPVAAASDALGERTVNLSLSDPTGDLGIGTLATATLTILEPVATTLTLTGSPGTVPSGQTVNLTATITPNVSTNRVPTGSVTFRDEIILLGSAPLDASGHATLTTTMIGAGVDTITATYSGDTILAASTGTTSEVVTDTSTTAFNAARLTAAYGDPINLRATVNAAGIGRGEAPGTVMFAVDGVAQAAVALQLAVSVGGSASADLTIPSLPPGSHVVTATYSGTIANAPSTATIAVTVPTVPAMVNLTQVPSVPVAGRPYVLIASPQGTTGSPATPTGFAEFLDGTTVIALLPLDAQGNAVLYIPSLSTAPHLFTVIYGGDASYAVAINRTANLDLAPPSVQYVMRGATGLVVQFVGALDPTSAQQTSNYRVATSAGRPDAVQSATYDPGSQTVTLGLASRIVNRLGYRFRINGTSPAGVRGISGAFLAGGNRAGTNYSGTVSPVFVISSPILVRQLTNPHPSGPARHRGLIQ